MNATGGARAPDHAVWGELKQKRKALNIKIQIFFWLKMPFVISIAVTMVLYWMDKFDCDINLMPFFFIFIFPWMVTRLALLCSGDKIKLTTYTKIDTYVNMLESISALLLVGLY